MNVTKTTQENFKNLIQLIGEHPDLPVLPMVDGEITESDEYGYYMASFGSAYLDEYIVCKRYAWLGQVFFKSDDDVFDVLEKFLTDEEFEKLPESEEGCKEVYNSLPWTKAIIVYIKPTEE